MTASKLQFLPEKINSYPGLEATGEGSRLHSAQHQPDPAYITVTGIHNTACTMCTTRENLQKERLYKGNKTP